MTHTDEINPYQSPQVELHPSHLVTWNPAAPLEAKLIKSNALYRCVRLFGRLEAELTWNANGPVEYVSVNGSCVASQHAFLRSIPRFDFDLHTRHRVIAVSVEVNVVWVYFTRAFQILVEHETAYTEGLWNSVR